MSSRKITQLFSLGVFVAVILLGRPQLWFLLFVVTTVAGLVVSRLYCGWLCPINTVLRISRRPGKVGKDIRHGNVIRGASIVLLLMGAISTMAFDLKLPLLPIIVTIGIVVGLYDERLFHSYLCPFGNIQRLVPRRGRSMAAHQHQCIGCGICEKVCPVSAIDVTERAMIDGRECINCGECEEICSEGAISSVRKRKEEDHEEGE